MTERKHISVCVCTYKRTELLRRLLLKLVEQETEGLFDYSIVIVDNDWSESARQTVESCIQQSKISINYYVEPEQNIALARNKAVENAKGHFIGFIDDDEFPVNNWLLNLYKAVERYKSDGVLGPVIPYFEEKPPKWVIKGRFFDRPTHPDGYVLGWKYTRTGNVLLRSELFKEDSKWFDPVYGNGGEDRDFFRRKIAENHIFVWCAKAPVFEEVPPIRWNKKILMKRALLRGEVAFIAKWSKHESILFSIIAIAIYTSCLPFFSVLGHHIFMKYLIKNCDHLGKVLAFFGINCIKEKYVIG